ncbi:MAG: Gp15 family bacteriophage protein [Eubacteriales bacterium]|nr:Gp15 family bacteriophage protein [Eubacteriales bacterium]
MSGWELPTSLNVCGTEYAIRSDFRAVLDILKYFSDPEYEPDEKWEICLDILYEDYGQMPWEHKGEAMRQALWFIDMGSAAEEKSKPHTMDWEQDAPIIMPAVNKVLGGEIRAREYLHWWTFLGAYMETGECLFAQVLSLRQKKATGKRFEKWERKFWENNKDICVLKKRYTEEEKAEQERLNALFD